jgi:hypothetical protein
MLAAPSTLEGRAAFTNTPVSPVSYLPLTEQSVLGAKP